MLELYHNINSVCAQKVRVALKEKGREAKEHLLTLLDMSDEIRAFIAANDAQLKAKQKS